jgi:hypothetical protein
MNLRELTANIKVKVIGILILLLLICYTKQSLNRYKLRQQFLPMPAFNQCSCDSSTYCLTDEDVIQLHMWQENVKFFARNKH